MAEDIKEKTVTKEQTKKSRKIGDVFSDYKTNSNIADAEITKMNLAPFILSIGFAYALHGAIIDSWLKLALCILIYTIIYIALLCTVSMNQYERNLFIDPIRKILKR